MTLTVLILLLLGLAAVLAVAELLLPTGGLLGVLAVVAVLAAAVTCFAIDTTLGVVAVVATVVLSPVAAWAGVRLWEKSPVGRRVILHDEVGRPVADRVAVGATGVAVSALRPMGEAEINGQTIQATSEFGDLPAGTAVQVIAFSDNLATVRPVRAEPVAPKADAATSAAASATSN